MTRPVIACICPTFDRYAVPRKPTPAFEDPVGDHRRSGITSSIPVFNGPSLLEEAIQSFINQDYPDKLLIILNDNRNVTLDFDHPLVMVVNRTIRYGSLGAKYNAAIEIARQSGATHVCSWDDDDISLPWRLSQAAMILERTHAEYFIPHRYWYLHGTTVAGGGPVWSHNHGMHLGLPTGCFSIEAFQQVGMFSHTSDGQDQALNAKLRESVLTAIEPPDLPLWSFVYRWGCDARFHFHLSGQGTGANAAYMDHRASPELPTGRYRLRPRWHTNYVTESAFAMPQNALYQPQIVCWPQTALDASNDPSPVQSNLSDSEACPSEALRGPLLRSFVTHA